MKNRLLLAGGLMLASYLFVFAPACTNDELLPPENPAFCDTISVTTYENGVKTIIDNSCAYAGCHDGAGGIGPGNYSGYSGLLPFLSNNAVFERVVSLRDNPSLGMPPSQSVYQESQKDNLTDDEFEIFQCWLLSGFPER